MLSKSPSILADLELLHPRAAGLPEDCLVQSAHWSVFMNAKALCVATKYLYVPLTENAKLVRRIQELNRQSCFVMLQRMNLGLRLMKNAEHLNSRFLTKISGYRIPILSHL